MATTADFKNGLCIEFNNEIYRIVDFQHVKPGKGPAFVRTKLKNLKTGKVIPNTFNSGVKIDIARIEVRPYQYLYVEAGGWRLEAGKSNIQHPASGVHKMYHFMNTQTFEQIAIEEEIISSPDLMKESQEVEITFNADTETPMSCELPPFVSLVVSYTEKGEKGNTATNVMKPATMETGAIINVPLFINTGEKIKIDTRTHNYSARDNE